VRSVAINGSGKGPFIDCAETGVPTKVVADALLFAARTCPGMQTVPGYLPLRRVYP
jgi:hypothetical protein